MTLLNINYILNNIISISGKAASWNVSAPFFHYVYAPPTDDKARALHRKRSDVMTYPEVKLPPYKAKGHGRSLSTLSGRKGEWDDIEARLIH